MTFYNTTHETGQILMEFRRCANSQDDQVLDLFCTYGHATPSEIHAMWPDEKTPITSIRRSINTLTKLGKLAKTERKRLSTYGRPEHVWRLKQPDTL